MITQAQSGRVTFIPLQLIQYSGECVLMGPPSVTPSVRPSICRCTRACVQSRAVHYKSRTLNDDWLIGFVEDIESSRHLVTPTTSFRRKLISRHFCTVVCAVRDVNAMRKYEPIRGIRSTSAGLRWAGVMWYLEILFEHVLFEQLIMLEQLVLY